MKVFVYYNLRTKTWSVRYKGKVIDHPLNITLRNCKLKVSEAGRQRVLREKRKNVHAGIEGEITELTNDEHNSMLWKTIIYNPYKYASFVEVNHPFTYPVYSADIVSMRANNRSVIALNPR